MGSVGVLVALVLFHTDTAQAFALLRGSPSPAVPRPKVARVAAVRATVGRGPTANRETGLLQASATTSTADEDGMPASSGGVLVLCCLIAAVCALDRVLISIAIIPMTEQFGYSDSTKGAIAAAFSVGYCAGLLPSGILSATTSPKVVLLGGLVVWSFAQAVSPASALVSVPLLLGARALMGVGEAAAVPSVQAIAARFVPADQRSKFWGVLTASLSCGTIAAYVVSPPLIESYGWPFVFICYGGIGGALALLWSVYGADAPADPTAGTIAPAAAQSASASSSGFNARLQEVPWADVVRSRPVWALAAAHSSNNFFMYFGLSWLPTYFSYQAHAAPAAIPCAADSPARHPDARAPSCLAPLPCLSMGPPAWSVPSLPC